MHHGSAGVSRPPDLRVYFPRQFGPHQDAVEPLGQVGGAALAPHLCVLLVAVEELLFRFAGLLHAASVVDVLLAPVHHSCRELATLMPSQTFETSSVGHNRRSCRLCI